MSIEHWTLDEARNVLIARYLYFVITAAWTWDALISYSNEANVFVGRRLALVDIVYILSRLLTGLTLYSVFPAIVLPRNNCVTPTHVVTWLGTAAAWLSTLLFLFRVNSVFYNLKPARIFFTFLWFIAAIGCLVVPFSFTAAPVQPGGLCVVATVSRLGVIPSLSIAVFDLCVYLSISYRTINFRATPNKWAACKAFFTGENTGTITKALLHTGQLYFFPMACLEGCVLSIEFSTVLEASILFQYEAAVLAAGLVFLNSMACRVFRLLRRLKIEGETTIGQSVEMSGMHFRRISRGEEVTGEIV
ncbi:hypothetical protein QCA50_011602 [Cerrena zonata]|uniref:Uncharacterized protein n=1 Tax=Cerrena zonata TaxID=2478898 RepID=A0AAW0G4L1_9APHY